MLTISGIFVALANTAVDPNTIYVIIGVVGVALLLQMASSGTAAKKVVKKYYCPHCHRQINFAAPAIKAEQYPLSARGQGNNLRLANQPKKIYPRVNAPIQRRGRKMYCPYCKREIIGN